MKHNFYRREFLKALGTLTALAEMSIFPAKILGDERKLVKFPEKTDLILLTSRPPNLETPLSYFKNPITSNEALFVRWHLGNIPTSIDLSEWFLKIGGHTERELSLSLKDLKNNFEKVTYSAVIQCAGNGRSFFDPRVPGGQWGNGAMGNVVWSGARLRDVLNRAGFKPGTVELAFNGLDKGVLPTEPDYMKSLPLDKALEQDTLIAYEMNGEPLTMLNGFPARLIVPGWYATYWVKTLSEIIAMSKPFEEFWVKTAYRIPADPCACVPPDSKPEKTVPIHRMNTRAIILEPQGNTIYTMNERLVILGLAFSGGYKINDVIISTDGGKTWANAELSTDQGKYSWVHWAHPWLPAKPGKYTIMARATNAIGESQPLERLWNPGGYMWNKIERQQVEVR